MLPVNGGSQQEWDWEFTTESTGSTERDGVEDGGLGPVQLEGSGGRCALGGARRIGSENGEGDPVPSHLCAPCELSGSQQEWDWDSTTERTGSTERDGVEEGTMGTTKLLRVIAVEGELRKPEAPEHFK